MSDDRNDVPSTIDLVVKGWWNEAISRAAGMTGEHDFVSRSFHANHCQTGHNSSTSAISRFWRISRSFLVHWTSCFSSLVRLTG